MSPSDLGNRPLNERNQDVSRPLTVQPVMANVKVAASDGKFEGGGFCG